MINKDNSPKPEVETVHPKRGTWRTYDVTAGLPAGVQCLLQDRQGYLWLGTRAGLCRYDGAEFIIYTTASGLASNNIVSIYEDRQGRLWSGTRGGGVSCFDLSACNVQAGGQRFITYTTAEGLADNQVEAICEDRQGRLWFGTWGGVSCFDGQGFITYTTASGLVHNVVKAICEDHQGRLWFGTWEDGVSCFDGECFITYTTASGLVHNAVKAICEDHQGRLWFGTWGGVSCFDEQGFITYTTASGLADNRVWSICEDHQGRLWFGTRGDGVSCRTGQHFITFTTKEGLLDNCVSGIIQDGEGHFWFAHLFSGLTRFDPETLQLLTVEPVSQILVQDRMERLWFSNEKNLCCRFDGYLRRQSFNAQIECLLEDSRGCFWVATNGDGLYCYDSPDAVWDTHSALPSQGGEKGSARHFTTEDGLGSNCVLSLLEARDRTIWAVTQQMGYLCRFDGKTFKAIPTPHHGISRLLEDSQGRIWMTGSHGLSCYDAVGPLQNYTMADGLPSDGVQSIVEDDAGCLWIGTLQGLCRFDGKHFTNYGKAQGFFSLLHQWSTKDTTGQLWFGTLGGGLYRTDGKYFQCLTTEDGLPSNSVTGLVPQPDGSMIIGTYRGVVHYRKTATLPPHIELREVVAGQIYPQPDILELTTTQSSLVTIVYHGLSLSTHKMRYSYILEGCDKEWQDTWESQVYYEKLPPGEYTFRVIAINRDLVTSTTPATLKLTVVPDARDVALTRLHNEVNNLRREVSRKYHFDNIIGHSTAIKWVYELMEKAIDSGLTVLISGETGTGKELVAKAIHYQSPRKNYPLLDLNCGAMPKELVASRLFGHRKGAFTSADKDQIGIFEAAVGGTVLLDEIGEMPPEAQVHLLRVLQERKVQRIGESQSRDVDVRVIAITNRDLMAEVQAGRFREDLYYRLNVFPIHIPALRERLDDMPLLAEHLLQKYCRQNKKDIGGFASGVFEMLQSYSWPGNVRELESAISYAAAFVETGQCIQTYHFPAQITQGESLIQAVLSEQGKYRELLDQFQRRLIENALKTCSGNRYQAAKILGMDRSNLVKLIKRLGIDKKDL